MNKHNKKILCKLISIYNSSPNCQLESNNDLYNSYTFYIGSEPTHLIFQSINLIDINITKLVTAEINNSENLVTHTDNEDVLFFLQSKRLFVLDANKLFSPDRAEKLQTCDFKRKQYQKLVKDLDLLVSYIYVLNSDWFDKPAYKDVLEYIESVNCNYCFDRLPLEWLGLPKPVSSN